VADAQQPTTDVHARVTRANSFADFGCTLQQAGTTASLRAVYGLRTVYVRSTCTVTCVLVPTEVCTHSHTAVTSYKACVEVTAVCLLCLTRLQTRVQVFTQGCVRSTQSCLIRHRHNILCPLVTQALGHVQNPFCASVSSDLKALYKSVIIIIIIISDSYETLFR